jgi:hypothetical protein
MIWHVIYDDRDGRVQSRAARSRDLAIHMACELLQKSYEVRRAIGPNGSVIERVELDAHDDEGRFPGLQRPLNLRTEFLPPAFYDKAPPDYDPLTDGSCTAGGVPDQNRAPDECPLSTESGP